jgi:hypothetical protein
VEEFTATLKQTGESEHMILGIDFHSGVFQWLLHCLRDSIASIWRVFHFVVLWIPKWLSNAYIESRVKSHSLDGPLIWSFPLSTLMSTNKISILSHASSFVSEDPDRPTNESELYFNGSERNNLKFVDSPYNIAPVSRLLSWPSHFTSLSFAQRSGSGSSWSVVVAVSGSSALYFSFDREENSQT